MRKYSIIFEYIKPTTSQFNVYNRLNTVTLYFLISKALTHTSLTRTLFLTILVIKKLECILYITQMLQADRFNLVNVGEEFFSTFIWVQVGNSY